MKILIDTGSGFVDYTRYCLDGTLTVEDSINVPTLTSFQLSPSDNTFVVPTQSSYVRIVSEIFDDTVIRGDGSVSSLGNNIFATQGVAPQAGRAYLAGPVNAWFVPTNESCNNELGAMCYFYPTNPSALTPSINFQGYSLNLQNNAGIVGWAVYDQNANQINTLYPIAPSGLFASGYFNMLATGFLYFPEAGTYYFKVSNEDGFIFAVNGAEVSPVITVDDCWCSPTVPFVHTSTPLSNYSFEGNVTAGYNTSGAQVGIYSVTVDVPGLYPFEIDWASHNPVTGIGYLNVQSVLNASGTSPQNICQIQPGQVLATGFVSNQPEAAYLGLNKNLPGFNFQQLTYTVSVTSDEWLLNANAVPYIPAFVNQTDSQILAAIAQALAPDGFFDVTSFMASGTLIPYYQYDPAQSWSQIAKTFADANRYWYKVKDRKIYYQPFGGQPYPNYMPGMGVAYDEQTQKESQIFPPQLSTNVNTVAPVNDCIVVGDTEPQDNWDNYFCGDGFTSNFQLRHIVFDGTSSVLLQDDWTESSFTSGTWTINDPEGVISLVDSDGNALGALNIVQKGAAGAAYTPIQNATYIMAQNGLELAGGLNLQHCQVTVNDTASGGGGLIGGLFEETSNYSPINCIAAFYVSGQPDLGSFEVVNVSVVDLLATLTLNGQAPASLNPGNVFTGSGFSHATFLNGETLYIETLKQHSNNTWSITCAVSTMSYGPTADTGTISFGADAVVVTASGAAGLYITPWYQGAAYGTPVVTQPNHQYVLQTWVGSQAPTRYTRQYSNLTGSVTYGAQNLAASGTISWVITDVNLGNYVVEEQDPLFGLFPAAPPPTVVQSTITGVTLPAFVVYVLTSSVNLNVSINYTLLSLPPQGYLTVQSLTGASGGTLPWLPSQLTAPVHYQLGYGQINQTAQISQQGEAYALSFYTDDIPSVGARIRFQSWAGGQSCARVQDPNSIATQAKVTGDNGVRSAIMTNLSPLPRSSDECEAAAAAALIDNINPQFQGTYTVQTIGAASRFENLYSPSLYQYPNTGKFLWINSPVRAVSGQNFVANTVRFQVVDLKSEVLTVSIDYGPDLYLEKLLPSFLESEQNLLVPQLTVTPPNPITLPEVLNAHLATLDAAQVTVIANALSGDYIIVDLSGGTEVNAPAASGILASIGATGCEVRYVDNGWGIPNQGRVGIFTVDQFILPRTIRDQTFYLRGINGNIFSRWSKALRVVYPLIPSPPLLVQYNATTIVLNFNGDVRDIYGLELRATPLSGYNFLELPNEPPDSIGYYTRQPLSGSLPYQPNGNAWAAYQPVGAATTFPYPFEFQVGDIVYLTCPADNSFQGIKLITDAGVLTPGVSQFLPTNYETASGTLNGNPAGEGYTNPNYAIDGSKTNAATAEASSYPTFDSTIGEIWYGFPPGSLTENWQLNVYLKIQQGAPPNGYDYNPDQNETLIQYTLDGGHTWSTLLEVDGSVNIFEQNEYYNPGTYSVDLPLGQDLTKVQMRAWAYGTGSYTFQPPIGGPELGPAVTFNWIYDIWISPQVGAYWGFSWFDHGLKYPDTQGNILPGTTQVGTANLFSRQSYVGTISVSITSAGVATITTDNPHGYVAGTQIMISNGWSPPAPAGQKVQDGTILCGVWFVASAANSTHFSIIIPNWTGGTITNAAIVGVTVPYPTSQTILAASGVLLQRPVFAPSDLVIDLTQPDIAYELSFLEAIQGGRVQGLAAYFFNLTWDYSYPTPIPSFQVPALSGVNIVPEFNQIVWGVAQGQPRGYRITSQDVNTGYVFNQVTIDHPYNPQGLLQYEMTQVDAYYPRQFTIVPFDALGDGEPSVIVWVGSVSGGGFGGSSVLLETNGIENTDQALLNFENTETIGPVSDNVGGEYFNLLVGPRPHIADWHYQNLSSAAASQLFEYPGVGMFIGLLTHVTSGPGFADYPLSPGQTINGGSQATSLGPEPGHIVCTSQVAASGARAYFYDKGNSGGEGFLYFPITTYWAARAYFYLGPTSGAGGGTGRLWVGMGDAEILAGSNAATPYNTNAASDNPSTYNGLLFRYSTNAGDTHWQAYASNGSGSTIIDTRVTPDFSGSGHIYEIRVVPGAVANFYIDEVLVASITTTLPYITQGAGSFIKGTGVSYVSADNSFAAATNDVIAVGLAWCYFESQP